MNQALIDYSAQFPNYESQNLELASLISYISVNGSEIDSPIEHKKLLEGLKSSLKNFLVKIY